MNSYIYFNQYSLGCEMGYIGINCDVRCTFPFFGLDCQLICNCSEKNCDYANGCKQSTKGMFYIWLILPIGTDVDLSSD